MSRREDRSSNAKHHRSRFDREPSPKRSRRVGKQETERPSTDTRDRSDRDESHRRRLQDAVPLEAPPAHEAKVETGIVSEETADKTSGQQGGTKHSSDPTKIPRSQSYFQHDDRGSVRKNGRGFDRRTDKEERGWWKDPNEDRADNATVASDAHRKEERAKDGTDRIWRHDAYFEMEANPKPPTRKRPSFTEQKIPADPEKTSKVVADVTQSPQDRAVESGRRDERGYSSRHSDRWERQFSRQREFNKADAPRSNFSYSDRNNSANNRYHRGNGERGYRPSGGGGDKWKHDLYNDANRSPSPKNEEDQISKIEALLAS